jgi:hypothetical protein
MTRKTNEATLEARIPEIIKQIFPSFGDLDIVHQLNFTLKFGHHNVKVDNEAKDLAKGRLDILLEIKAKPIAILELKRSDLVLTQEDVNQGISYARLTEPITPITIISNGNETWIYDTITSTKLSNASLDEKTIKTIIEKGLTIAEDTKKEAIGVLLGNDVKLFSQVIKNITEMNFVPFIGKTEEIKKPISKEFSIDREAVKSINDYMVNRDHLITIVGGPFSGKTNVFWQYFNKNDWSKNAVYYIDSTSSYGFFQQLANALTKTLQFPITKERVRNWLINGFVSTGSYKITVCFDNWRDDVHPDLQSELLELIDLFRETGNSIIIGINEFEYNRITRQKNRIVENVFGNDAKKILVKPLNSSEFSKVNKVMYETCKAIFGAGAVYHPIYLQPKTLRIIARNIILEEKTLESKGEFLNDRGYGEIHSVPSTWLLGEVDSLPINEETKIILNKITKVFLEESLQSLTSEMYLTRYTTGAVTHLNLIKQLDQNNIYELVREGFLIKSFLTNGELIYFPALVEYISIFSVNIIAKECIEISRNISSQKAYEYFIKSCDAVPLGDIVGAKIISLIGHTDDVLFDYLVRSLENDIPKESLINNGSELLTNFNSSGIINIKFKGEIKEKLMGNILPWTILSHLLVYPLKSNHPDSPFTLYFDLLKKIGSFEGGLLYINQAHLSEPFSLISRSVPKYGEILDSSMGVVEPIVHAIRMAIREIPSEMIEFTKEQVKLDNFHLIQRINLATLFMDNIPDKDLELAKKEIFTITSDKLRDMLDDVFFTEYNVDLKALREKRSKEVDELKNKEND